MHAISPYMVTVTDFSGNLQDLWNIAGSSLHDFLKNIYYPSIKGVQKIVQLPTATEPGKNFIFDDLYAGATNSVAGVYKTGHFGFDTKIIDTLTNKPVFDRGRHQSDMRPFPFSFYFPHLTGQAGKAANLRGMLLLYRVNTSGIRGMVMPDLVVAFESYFPGLRLKIDKVVPTSVVTSVLQAGEVRKIRLIQNTLPADYSAVLKGNNIKKFYEFEAIIKPKQKTPFDDVNWLIDAIQKKTPVASVFTIPNVPVNKIKVEVSKRGKRRTIDLSNLDRLSSVIELENPVVGGDGHIDTQFWLDEADSLADDLFEELDIQIPQWNSTV